MKKIGLIFLLFIFCINLDAQMIRVNKDEDKKPFIDYGLTAGAQFHWSRMVMRQTFDANSGIYVIDRGFIPEVMFGAYFHVNSSRINLLVAPRTGNLFLFTSSSLRFKRMKNKRRKRKIKSRQ